MKETNYETEGETDGCCFLYRERERGLPLSLSLSLSACCVCAVCGYNPAQPCPTFGVSSMICKIRFDSNPWVLIML
jgi:hypothetical protein